MKLAFGNVKAVSLFMAVILFLSCVSAYALPDWLKRGGIEESREKEVVKMGVIEEILKNKEEIIIKLIEVMQGKEAKTKVSLNGVKFNVGEATVKLEGDIELTFVPPRKK